jgi:hypothetical protein
MSLNNSHAQTANKLVYSDIPGTWMGYIIGVLPSGNQSPIAQITWRIHHIDLKNGNLELTEISYVGKDDSFKTKPNRTTFSTYQKDGKLSVAIKNPHINTLSFIHEKQGDATILQAEFKLNNFSKGVYFLVKFNSDTSTYKASNLIPPKVDVVKFPLDFNN